MKIKNCRLQFLLCLVLLAGCKDSTSVSGPAGPRSAAISGQYRDELLTYAIDNLNRLEEFESADVLEQMLQRLKPQDAQSDQFDPLLAAWPEPEMLRQIIDRLNQWIRTQQPPADWQLDPMAAALPKPLADLPQIKDLDRMQFSRFDGYALQEAVWLRDISLWARGDALDDLERAKSLFDWTVRNIQLEADTAQRTPQFPWETLLFGRGAATERAWVFILLARQLGIDAAMLGIDEGGGEKGKGGRGKGEGNSNLPSPDQPSVGARKGAGGEGGVKGQSQSALTLALSQRERGPNESPGPPPPVTRPPSPVTRPPSLVRGRADRGQCVSVRSGAGPADSRSQRRDSRRNRSVGDPAGHARPGGCRRETVAAIGRR